MLQLDYENKAIIVMEHNKNMYELNLVFPYEIYKEQYQVIREINNLVSSDGVVCVYANNVVYNLKAGIFIKTTKNLNRIKKLANNNNLVLDTSLGENEIFAGLAKRQYNLATLLPEMTFSEIKETLSRVFQYPSKSDLEKQGYGFDEIKKKKIFVSYSHKDKALVYDTIQNLQDKGFDFWIDYKQIDYGDSIIEKVNQGIKESDLPILFLSHHTKESLFAKYELKNFLKEIIYKQDVSKPWFIIKLDDVDLDDLFVGLSDYKYFDYQVQNFEELSQVIQEKLK
jgi:hypothetical protein